MAGSELRQFDGRALFRALDERREADGLSWRGVADALWEQSAALNDRRNDHPISPSTLLNLDRRGATSCQHALFMLRWLDRSPESFLAGASVDDGVPLPATDPDHRLRFDLRSLYAALDEHRRELDLTWPQCAKVIGCTPSQLTGIRTARFATGMNVAMRIVQWLGQPAAEFVKVTRW